MVPRNSGQRLKNRVLSNVGTREARGASGATGYRVDLPTDKGRKGVVIGVRFPSPT